LFFEEAAEIGGGFEAEGKGDFPAPEYGIGDFEE
jgi:hypothetical protein